MTSLEMAVVRAKLQTGSCVDIQLRGRCMEPLLVAGDRVRVCVANDLCVGDVALVVLGTGELALHRVVELSEKLAVTKGDYSGKSEILPISSVLGVAMVYSLDGGPWVEEVRSRDELERLVNLSARVGDSSESSAAKRECRDVIWELNSTARARMLGEEQE